MPKSGALFRKGCQKVTHLLEHEELSSKKVLQKVESFFKRCAKKWSTFSKSRSKIGAPIKILEVLGKFSLTRCILRWISKMRIWRRTLGELFRASEKVLFSKIFCQKCRCVGIFNIEI